MLHCFTIQCGTSGLPHQKPPGHLLKEVSFLEKSALRPLHGRDWRLLHVEVHGIWKNPKLSKPSTSWRWWLSLFNQSSINLQCNSEGVWIDSSSHLWISIDTISTRNWGQVEDSLQDLLFQTASRIFHHSWARLSSSYTHSWGPARQVATGTHRFNKKWTPRAIHGNDASSVFITVWYIDDFIQIREGSKQTQ